MHRLLFKLSFCFILLFVSFSDVSAQPQNNFFQSGRVQFQRGNYVDAIRYFSYEIKIDPNSFRSYYLRGLSKINLDDLIGADQDFSSAIQVAPYFSDFFFNRALVRSQLNSYEAAFKDYKDAIALDSLNPEIYFRRAQTNLNLKNFKEVVDDCKKMFELDFHKENVYIISGIAKSGIGEHREALKDLEIAINYNPDNKYSLTQRASVYQELNLIDSALMDLNHAIEIDSNYSYAYFNRASVWMKIEDNDKALSDLNKVIKLSPYNSYAYFNRAIIMSSMDKKFEAVNDYSNVIQLNPNHIMSYFYRGRMKFDLKNYEGAEADYNKTIELYPEFADVYQARQRVRSKLNNLEGAESDRRKFLSLNEDGDLKEQDKSKDKAEYLSSLVKLTGDFVNSDNEGQVQYQHIDINLLDIFSVTYRNINQETTYFYDAINHLSAYHTPFVSLSNSSEEIELKTADKYIQQYNEIIDSSAYNPNNYLNRALVNINIEDFNQSFNDLNKILEETKDYGIAYFLRANARLKLIELLSKFENDTPTISINEQSQSKKTDSFSIKEHRIEDVLADYDQCIGIDPNFSFAFYNRAYVKAMNGDLQSAITDFSEALKLNNKLSEAYYNRGLILIYMKKEEDGCKDLSRAGELGLKSSYNVMKRYCFK